MALQLELALLRRAWKLGANQGRGGVSGQVRALFAASTLVSRQGKLGGHSGKQWRRARDDCAWEIGPAGRVQKTHEQRVIAGFVYGSPRIYANQYYLRASDRSE